MTYVGITIAILVVFAIQQRAFNQERQDWTKERQLLITRIQHPEYVVAGPQEIPLADADYLREETDEIDRVGEIVGASNGD